MRRRTLGRASSCMDELRSGKPWFRESPAHEPQDEGQDQANQQFCPQRRVKYEILSLDRDVTGQPPEPDFLDPWPKQANSCDDETQDNQRPRHGLLSVRT